MHSASRRWVLWVLLAALGAVPPGLTFAAGEAPAARGGVPATRVAALPARVSGTYAVLRGDDGFEIGRIGFEWRRDGDRYEAQSVTETTGVVALFSKARVVQASRGEIAAEGLRPLDFRHEKPKGREHATLDWARRTVSYRDRVEPLPPGTQDPVSMYFQIALRLAGRDAARAAATAIELPIATGTKLETYRFSAPGETMLKTAAGDVPAWHTATRNGDDSIELWYAMRGGWLPLRIRIGNGKGEVYDQRLIDEAPGGRS